MSMSLVIVGFSSKLGSSKVMSTKGKFVRPTEPNELVPEDYFLELEVA